MTKEDYYNIYGRDGDLNLPRTYRTYFDSLCHEYSCYPVKQKMLDLGYVISHGFDIKSVILNIPEEYEHVSVDDVQTGVNAIRAAACHVNLYKSGLYDTGNSLEADIDLMIEEVMREYRLPLDGSNKHYMADNPHKIERYELHSMNGWNEACDMISPYEMFCDGNTVAFPDDNYLIRMHNLRMAEDYREFATIFPSFICPEPWYGNPLNARVIILGDMPEYDDFISRCQNLMLSHFPQLAESVQYNVRRWMQLTGKGMYKNDKAFTSLPINNAELNNELCTMVYNTMDAYNSQNYRHWVKEIRELAACEDCDSEDLLDNIAVINSNPYYAIGKDPLAAGLLPSHYFLRNLVRYITNKDGGVKFIIPSKELDKVWRIILADVYTDLRAFGRAIVCEKENSRLHIDARQLGSSAIMEIVRECLKPY